MQFNYIKSEEIKWRKSLWNLKSMFKTLAMGLPWWSLVKNPPPTARDSGSVTALGTKSPHALEQLSRQSPCVSTREAHALQQRVQPKTKNISRDFCSSHICPTTGMNINQWHLPRAHMRGWKNSNWKNCKLKDPKHKESDTTERLSTAQHRHKKLLLEKVWVS